jgi:hypothetical protein
MKKRSPKKLQLTTETLRHLYPGETRHAKGGADQQCTSADSSGNGYTEEPSYCTPCTTDYTFFQAFC